MHEASGKIRKTISFNRKNEKDIPLIERAESVENFNDYVKRLIEKDIKSRKIIKDGGNKPIQPGHTAGGPIMTKGTSLTLITE